MQHTKGCTSSMKEKMIMEKLVNGQGIYQEKISQFQLMKL